jgi:hypothetical protein
MNQGPRYVSLNLVNQPPRHAASWLRFRIVPGVIVPRYWCRILQSRGALVPDRAGNGRFVHTGELGNRQFTLREANGGRRAPYAL